MRRLSCEVVDAVPHELFARKVLFIHSTPSSDSSPDYHFYTRPHVILNPLPVLVLHQITQPEHQADFHPVTVGSLHTA
ncbi:hypothetical protein C0Q70_02620 [Pomacea canaliculata]|uniref:Uncharacterized protein n=1 Tax=Pomacea canaliculata TaxID=400727 RepID=A0A2T7PQK3_POMCA|nr:hypothetical protein C0Q70_02620 [Pomacea canaliculata]